MSVDTYLTRVKSRVAKGDGTFVDAGAQVELPKELAERYEALGAAEIVKGKTAAAPKADARKELADAAKARSKAKAKGDE